MREIVISVERLSKQYRLGVINHGRLTKDLQSWWARIRSKPDPNIPLGMADARRRTIEGDRFWALQDVSFDVKHGDRLGIIGRNGAGKSTLLKILSRVTAPTKGQIKVKGRVASLLEVGTGFHPELTGRENIFLNGAIMGMKREEIRKKLDEIVAFAEVESFIDTPVKRYSSGMYVRLGFAVAAHLEPDILVVDEVLAVGDVGFQKKCLGKMQDVSRNEGRTVLFVSHNMTAIENLCEVGIFLNDGSVDFIGGASDAVERYISSIRSEMSKSVSERKDSKGDGAAMVSGLRIESIDGRQLQSVPLQAPFALALDVLYKSPQDCSKVEFTILLSDENDVRIMSFQSRLENGALRPRKSMETVRCILAEGLPLSPGEYRLGYSVVVNGLLADKLLNAKVLRVQPARFFESDELPPSFLGRVLWRTRWDQV